VINDILCVLYILGLGEYKCDAERTDMSGHVCGMIFVLDQSGKKYRVILLLEAPNYCL